MECQSVIQFHDKENQNCATIHMQQDNKKQSQRGPRSQVHRDRRVKGQHVESRSRQQT